MEPNAVAKLFLAVVSTQLFITGCRGIVMTGIEVPERVLEGDRVRLQCKFRVSSPRERLYSLKWYKSGQEFFRLLPNGDPQVKHFPLPGVNTQVFRLDKYGVILDLSDVDVETSGRYTCEVSGEAPTFDTKAAYRDLLVVVLPKSGPVIKGGRNFYSVGDTVNVSCAAGPSSPPPNITWLINDQYVKDSYLSGPRYSESEESSCCKSSELALSFVIEKDHFQEEGGVHVLKLKCLSSIDSVYWTSSSQDASHTTMQPYTSGTHLSAELHDCTMLLMSALVVYCALFIVDFTV